MILFERILGNDITTLNTRDDHANITTFNFKLLIMVRLYYDLCIFFLIGFFKDVTIY